MPRLKGQQSANNLAAKLHESGRKLLSARQRYIHRFSIHNPAFDLLLIVFDFIASFTFVNGILHDRISSTIAQRDRAPLPDPAGLLNEAHTICRRCIPEALAVS